MKKTYWPYVICAYLSLLSMGLLDNVRGAFYPDILNQFQLSDTLGAWFYMSTSLVAFVFSYYSGHMVNRFGILNGLRLGLVTLAIGYGFMGLSENFTQVIIGAIGFGVGFGLISSIINLAVSEGASLKHRRQLFSGLHTNFALAALMAPVISNFLISFNLTWEQSFVIVCILPVSVFIYAITQKEPDAEVESSYKVKTLDEAAGSQLQAPWWVLVLMSLSLVFYLWTEIGIGSRLVIYSRRFEDLTAIEANTRLTFFFMSLLIGRILFSVRNWPIKNINVLCISSVGAGICILLGLNLSSYLICLSGFFMAPFFAVLIDYIVELYPKRSAAMIPIVVAFGSLGIVAMHFVIGALTDLWGIHAALYVAAISGFLCGSCAWLHHKFTDGKGYN